MVYSRVVGYITSVQAWNKGKKQEWKERTPYETKEQRDDDDDRCPG